MAYKHGVYGTQIPFSGQLAAAALGTIPAYVGTAPIHQVNADGAAGYNYAPLIGKPILINSLADAKTKIGYSDSWDSFTLGEAVKAHFDNGVAGIGPIVVVNLANPGTKKSTNTVATVTLSGSAGNKTGLLNDPLAAIENIAVTSSTAITSGDYTLAYEGDGVRITITKEGYNDKSCTATYKQVDVSDTVITATVFETALSALDQSESKLGVIPNVLAAPGYSEKPAYHAKMISKAAAKISQKWYLVCVSDITADAAGDTIAKAIAWKDTNGYISKLDKVCWPMAKYGGVVYHLSTLAIVTMQQQDTNVDGVPYISPSNKIIYATSAVTKAGVQLSFDEIAANSLNEVGITTVNLVRGTLRLWGPHMGNYNFIAVDGILPEDRSDSSIRVMQYLLNTLQYQYLDTVDKPFSRRDIDSIKASIQQWLNGLVNEGKLLYGVVEFTEDSNSVGDMVNGDFVFDVATTTTPNAKSITFKVQYSIAGLATLTGGEA